MPSKRVLIADDAMDFGRMLQASLATLDTGMKITLVPSAEEALLETNRLAPDLLVADLRLPGMSGLELLRKVRARYPAVRVIVVTGLKETGLEEKILQAGADCFFVKPLSMDVFLRSAGQLLAVGQPNTVPSPTTPTQVEAPRRGATGPLGAPSGTGRLRLRVTPERAAEMISGLRQTLNARMVILADRGGNVIARAGEHDEIFEQESLPAALAALNSSRKLAHIAGGNTQSALVFKGKEIEMVIAPVGDLALLIGLRAGRTQLRLSLAFEEAFNFQKECSGILDMPPAQPAVLPNAAPAVQPRPVTPPAAQVPPPQITVPPAKKTVAPPPAEPDLDETPADLGDLEKLFAKPLSPGHTDLDDFWEKALDGTGDRVASPDVISYEQARQMGLHKDNGNGNGHFGH